MSAICRDPVGLAQRVHSTGQHAFKLNDSAIRTATLDGDKVTLEIGDAPSGGEAAKPDDEVETWMDLIWTLSRTSNDLIEPTSQQLISFLLIPDRSRL